MYYLLSGRQYYRLFAGVPPKEPANFAGVRARGGFVANATLGSDGAISGAVHMKSEVGMPVKLMLLTSC